MLIGRHGVRKFWRLRPVGGVLLVVVQRMVDGLQGQFMPILAVELLALMCGVRVPHGLCIWGFSAVARTAQCCVVGKRFRKRRYRRPLDGGDGEWHSVQPVDKKAGGVAAGGAFVCVGDQVAGGRAHGGETLHRGGE